MAVNELVEHGAEGRSVDCAVIDEGFEEFLGKHVVPVDGSVWIDAP